MSLGLNIVLPVDLRSSRGEFIFFVNLEKWKTLNFLYSITRLNFLKREEMIVLLQYKIVFDFL